MKQQKVQAILMATDKSSKIGFIHESNSVHIYSDEENPNDLLDNLAVPHHLHIISDEEIKEDYNGCYLWNNKILKTGALNDIDSNKHHIKYFKESKKIISSTDVSLGLHAPDNNSIQYIIDEFNSGKTEVYGIVDRVGDWDEHYQAYYADTIRIKTNPDNTISIKPIEESWDDVFDAFNKQDRITPNYWMKWLKQNYSVPTKLK